MMQRMAENSLVRIWVVKLRFAMTRRIPRQKGRFYQTGDYILIMAFQILMNLALLE
jgi:hypothetical protein